jgi:UDP-N-acetyl-D-mannosaminuronic acid dehydrogenase
MQLGAFSNNNFQLGHAAMLVNEGIPLNLIRAIEKRYELKSMTVGILGMSFKAESDDVRSSLSYKLKKILQFKSHEVLTADPYVKTDPELIEVAEVLKRSDLIIIGAPHECFKNLKFNSPVIDVWDFLGKGNLI